MVERLRYETSYDALDRVASVSAFAVDGSGNVDSAQTRTVQHCYDLAGDLRSQTAPKGSTSFTGCPAGSAPDTYTYTAASFTTRFAYDAAHRNIKQTAPDSTVSETGYDDEGNVVWSEDENGKRTTFAYDDRGAKVKEVTPFNGSRVLTQLWEYDALGSLSRYISPRAYDSSSSQTSFTDYVTTYSYDALGRLTKTTLPADSATPQAYAHVAYDANGNQTVITLPTTQPSLGAVQASEKTLVDYFDTGTIYSQTDPATPTIRYDYTAEGWQSARVPELTGQPGAIDMSRAMYWDYLGDGLLKQLRDLGATLTDGTNRYSYVYDPHGSVSLLLDQANGVKASHGYTAYGVNNAALTKTSVGFNGSINSYLYTGKRFDAGSSTYDMGARRYSAPSGRFLQNDAYVSGAANLELSRNPLSANRYALAGGNPLNYVEIDGHRVTGDGSGETKDVELALRQAQTLLLRGLSQTDAQEAAESGLFKSIGRAASEAMIAQAPSSAGAGIWSNKAKQWIISHRKEIAITAALVVVSVVVPAAGPALLATRAGLAAQAATRGAYVSTVLVTGAVGSRIKWDQSTAANLADCLVKVASVIKGSGSAASAMGKCGELILKLPKLERHGGR